MHESAFDLLEAMRSKLEARGLVEKVLCGPCLAVSLSNLPSCTHIYRWLCSSHEDQICVYNDLHGTLTKSIVIV